jgi:pimeloyl-ACP methyl ester carboxylesterase
LVVQVGVQAATIHAIVKVARQGPTASYSYFPRVFNRIILAGASLGSIVANEVTSTYPTDIDAVILGAFTKVWVNAVPGFIVTAELLPARLIQPNMYGSLPVGYLAANSQSGVDFLLFYGPGEYYDTQFIAWDYQTRGTISVDEGATGALGIFQANQYTGRVLVITGQQDVVFCGTTGLEASGVGNCGSGSSSLLVQTQSLYPSALNYICHAVANSGHCWMHQYSAQDGFKFLHQWLTDNGF